MPMMQEFKTFAMRGNVIDLAVGVVIGASFGKIVASLVDKIIMPLLGLVVGTVNFSSLTVQVGKATIGYGAFLQATLDFVIIAFAIFMMVKGMNTLNKKESAKPAPPPEPTADVKLLGEIRDLLKAKA